MPSEEVADSHKIHRRPTALPTIGLLNYPTTLEVDLIVFAAHSKGWKVPTPGRRARQEVHNAKDATSDMQSRGQLHMADLNEKPGRYVTEDVIGSERRLKP